LKSSAQESPREPYICRSTAEMGDPGGTPNSGALGSLLVSCIVFDAWDVRRLGNETEGRVLGCLAPSASCVQRLDDSRTSAIRITSRSSLRSSSVREPRDPGKGVIEVQSQSGHAPPKPRGDDGHEPKQGEKRTKRKKKGRTLGGSGQSRATSDPRRLDSAPARVRDRREPGLRVEPSSWGESRAIRARGRPERLAGSPGSVSRSGGC
jgi:hypothetical protein